MLGVILAVAVATASPPPAAAPAAGPGVKPAANLTPKDADPLVCHSESESGTRLTHRVCMRASEAARRRMEDRQALQDVQGTRPATGMSMMGPPR